MKSNCSPCCEQALTFLYAWKTHSPWSQGPKPVVQVLLTAFPNSKTEVLAAIQPGWIFPLCLANFQASKNRVSVVMKLVTIDLKSLENFSLHIIEIHPMEALTALICKDVALFIHFRSLYSLPSHVKDLPRWLTAKQNTHTKRSTGSFRSLFSA